MQRHLHETYITGLCDYMRVQCVYIYADYLRLWFSDVEWNVLRINVLSFIALHMGLCLRVASVSALNFL